MEKLDLLSTLCQRRESFFSYHNLGSKPESFLRTIDQLWGKYSNGRFGFSVQKRIYSVSQSHEVHQNLNS
ncbi:GUN4 domain-containing protein [Microcystis aeruginosa]|uniref:GUN4 domain-containing protein n=1 Tax=Microcystis aeruginosa TaxID=1126 RepID=UPI0008FF9DAE|nr:GUN4 domain-containing protein [Microcystis aeruginosa]